MPVMIDAVPEAWLESLKKFEALDIAKIVPGHGTVCDKSELKVMSASVLYCTEALKVAVAKGWSLAEVQEKVTFAERFPRPPGDPMKTMRHECIAHMYEILKK
jgi:glyoxylase-like metal-dependent hydrolase (beta-lactamase superfamily II)